MGEQWTDEDEQEYRDLQHYERICSLGDRPMAPSVGKIRRLIDLEVKREIHRGD